MQPAPTAPRHPTFTRRSVLQAGSIGLMGLGVNHLNSLRAAEGSRSGRDHAKSAIYIFLPGGAAQHDTFDPKPAAPAGIRSKFQAIQTATPDVIISEHLPLLAQRSEKWAL